MKRVLCFSLISAVTIACCVCCYNTVCIFHYDYNLLLHEGVRIPKPIGENFNKTGVSILILTNSSSSARELSATYSAVLRARASRTPTQLAVADASDSCGITFYDARGNADKFVPVVSSKAINIDGLPIALLVHDGIVKAIASSRLSQNPESFLSDSLLTMVCEPTSTTDSSETLEPVTWNVNCRTPEQTCPVGGYAICRFCVSADESITGTRTPVAFHVVPPPISALICRITHRNHPAPSDTRESEITVQLPITKQGLNNATIALETADARYRRSIDVQARGDGAVSIDKRIVDFGTMLKGSGKEASVEITKQGNTPMPEICYEGKLLRVRKEDLGKNNRKYLFSVSPEAKCGTINERATVVANTPGCSFGCIYIRARICGKCAIVPASLDFGVGHPLSNTKFELLAKATNGEVLPASILCQASSSHPNITLQATSGGQITGTFTFPKEPGIVEGVIVVKKNDPVEPEVAIPFMAISIPAPGM